MNNKKILFVVLLAVVIGCGGGTSGSDDTNNVDTGASPGERTAAPTFDPPAGTYRSEQTVSISTATTGATIKYTRGSSDDTSPPTSSNNNGLVYSSPLEINKTTTVKTVCFKDGMTESVSTARYVVTQCDCQDHIFCYDFERADLYGYCSALEHWETDDTDNTYYAEHEVLANGGRNGAYGLKLTGASSAWYRGRQGFFHHLDDLAPSNISFYVGTMSTAGDTGYFNLSQSISGVAHYGIVFHFGNDGKMYVNDIAYGNYSISTWYLIEFRNVQWRSGSGATGAVLKSTFDFYVNGTLVASNANFKDAALTGFDFLMLYNLDSTEIWYDDIIMTD